MEYILKFSGLHSCCSYTFPVMSTLWLLTLGFIGGNVDPCLYVKKCEKGITYVALYLDKNLMIEDVAVIDSAITALKENKLVLKIVEGLQDYLFHGVKFSMDKKWAWLWQPHVIKSLVKKFGNHVKNIHCHKAPGMPTFLLLYLWSRASWSM